MAGAGPCPFLHRHPHLPHLEYGLDRQVVVLGGRALVDVPTALIALTILAFLLRWKRGSEPVLLLAAGLLGVALGGSVIR